MQIGHRRNDGTRKAAGASRCFTMGDRGDATTGIDGEDDIVGPAVGKQGLIGMEQMMIIYAISSVRPHTCTSSSLEKID